MGSCLTLRNELSEETHVLTEQETLLGRGRLSREQEGKGPRRTALFLVQGFTVMGLVSGSSLANHSNSRVLPCQEGLSQPE